MLIALIAIIALSYLSVYLLQYLGQKVIRDIKEKVFSKIVGLSLNFYSKNKVGYLNSRIVNDTQVLHEVFASGLSNLAGDIYFLIAILIKMSIINIYLTLIIIRGLFILPALSSILLEKNWLFIQPLLKDMNRPVINLTMR